MDTDWACVLFGTLLCLDCAGRHRSLGVKVSFVRSVYLDAWSPKHIEILRHGGNGRFKLYLQQCRAGFKDSNYDVEEYLRLCKSPEAEEYKEKLLRHVDSVMASDAVAAVNTDGDEDSIFTANIVEVYDDECEEVDSFGNIIITSPGQNTPRQGMCGDSPGRTHSGLPAVPPIDTGRVVSPPSDFPMPLPPHGASTDADPESHAYIAEWMSSPQRHMRFSCEFPTGPMGMSIAADKGFLDGKNSEGVAAVAGDRGVSSYACVTKTKSGGCADDRGVRVGDVVVGIGGDVEREVPLEYREVTRLVSTHPRPVTVHFAREAVPVSPQSEWSPRIHTLGSVDSAGKTTPHKRRHSFAKAVTPGSGSKSRSGLSPSVSAAPAPLKEEEEKGEDQGGGRHNSSANAESEAALEELEDVLLTPQEKTYSRGASETVPSAVPSSVASVPSSSEPNPETTASATAELGQRSDETTVDSPVSDISASPPASATVRLAARRSRVPFAAEAEPEEEEEEEVVVRGSGDGHDVSILMEQVAQVPQEDMGHSVGPAEARPPVSSSWEHTSPPPASIQIRQQSANSWEYEVLFLTKPYGFTLSKSSAPETHPNLNTTPHPAVVTKVLERSKAAQQGVVEGDTVIAVNREYTPTYEDVLAQIDQVYKRCVAASADTSSSSSSTAQVPIIFLLRRSVSYIVASTSSLLATESKKLLADTISLSRTFLDAISPSASTSASPGVSRTSTPGVPTVPTATESGAGAGVAGSTNLPLGSPMGSSIVSSGLPPFMRPMDSGRRQSSLGSGTASIVINTKNLSVSRSPSTPATK